MRYMVSEKKLGVALLMFALGIFLAAQVSLLAQPALLSEKGLLFLVLSIGLILCSAFIAVRSVKKA